MAKTEEDSIKYVKLLEEKVVNNLNEVKMIKTKLEATSEYRIHPYHLIYTQNEAIIEQNKIKIEQGEQMLKKLGENEKLIKTYIKIAEKNKNEK